MLHGKPHPEQGFRSCLGIIRLADRYDQKRLEAACARAHAIGSVSYKSISSILATGMDSQPLPVSVQPRLPLEHGNIRGPDYYC